MSDDQVGLGGTFGGTITGTAYGGGTIKRKSHSKSHGRKFGRDDQAPTFYTSNDTQPIMGETIGGSLGIRSECWPMAITLSLIIVLILFVLFLVYGRITHNYIKSNIREVSSNNKTVRDFAKPLLKMMK